MTNLKRCLLCRRVFKFSDRHLCFDVAPVPASSWDPGIKALNKKRGTRHRPRRPTVLLGSPPQALTPLQGAQRRRCMYCRKVGADVEVRTQLVTGRAMIVLFKHSGCGKPAPRVVLELPEAIVLPTSVQCVECGAELLDGSHRDGCPFHAAAGTMPAEEGADA